jgi:hypothetical protein
VVRYLLFDGEQVSYEWWVFLTCARHDGVVFHLNEGHRTIARQTYFRWLYEHVPGSALAAKPSATAPHIRTGRIDHAVDVDNLQGLIDYGRRHGVTISRTVRWADGTVREIWHGEAPAGQLRTFARRHSDAASPLSFLRADERSWVTEYVRLKKANHDRPRRAVLRRVMEQRRQEIFKAASGHLPGATRGWNTLNRRRRWALLRRYTA